MHKTKLHLRSLLFLMVGVSAIGLLLQACVAGLVSARSVDAFEQSMIDAKAAETATFSDMFRDDLDSFTIQSNNLLLSPIFKRLMLCIDEQPRTVRYLQDAQYVWENITARQNSFDFIDQISIYLINSRIRITGTSILPCGKEEMERFRRLLTLRDEGNMVYDGNALYLWSSSHFSKHLDFDKASTVWLASCSGTALRQYLKRYQTDERLSNLFVAYTNEGERTLLAALSNAEGCSKILAALPGHERSGGLSCVYEGERVIVSWAEIKEGNLCLIQITSWDALSGKISDYRKVDALSNGVILMIGAGFMVLLYGLVSSPLRRLQRALNSMESGELDVRLGKSWSSEFRDVFNQFDSMATRIQNLVEEEYELQLLNVRSELKQLQYQISPHFLYNTYFILCGLLNEEEYEQAESFSDLLGRFLRYITASGEDTVFLWEELDHARAYAQIQAIRFVNRVMVEIADCPPECREMKIPRLILQPLIENAFEHGTRKMFSGGIIRLTFQVSDEYLHVIVEDNGQYADEQHIEAIRNLLKSASLRPGEKESIALYNIDRRLRMLYGYDSGLQIGVSDLGGVKASIKIRRGKAQ